MFRTVHPQQGGWYIDVVMTAEAVTDEDGVVGRTTGTVGPFEWESEAQATADHFEAADHIASWTLRREEPASP